MFYVPVIRPNVTKDRSSNSATYGHNSAGTDSSAEFNRLSGELSLRISREIDEVMNSVSAQIHQIQRAINDAISNQVLPQIQNALRGGSGPVTQKGRNVSAEKPERVTEDSSNLKTRSSSKSEPLRNRLHDESADSTHDTSIERNFFYSFAVGQNYRSVFS